MSENDASKTTLTGDEVAEVRPTLRPRSTLDEVEELPGERATALGARQMVEARKREIAYLTVIRGQQTGKRFRLGPETVIGRSPDAKIQLLEGQVSRLHARVVESPSGDYVIEDLGSHNGTRVNGDRVSRHVLAVGDRVGVGGVVLLFGRRSAEEEELLEQQKLESIGRLAGGVAHDFNNLLSVILGTAHMLRESVLPLQGKEDAVEECFGDLVAAAEDASSLVRQLLGFARRGKWEESPVDVSAVVEETVRLLRRPLGAQVEVSVQTVPGLEVIGDESQIKQMVMNLCLNARDAMPEGGQIALRAWYDPEPSEVRLAGRGPQVRLSVSDQGIGMTQEMLDQIFEPFFTTKELGLGTGLGLATVHGIVTHHGGRVWAESEPGRGSTFHVSLPACGAMRSEDLHRTVTPDAEAPSAAPGLLLLVDDDAMVRRSLARMVRSLGYEVVEAADGLEALERYRERQDDIQAVILDLVMPRMSGEEALEQLLNLDADARVIVVSGYHDEARADQLRARGALGFLPKPFSRDELGAALALVRKGGRLRPGRADGAERWPR